MCFGNRKQILTYTQYLLTLLMTFKATRDDIDAWPGGFWQYGRDAPRCTYGDHGSETIWCQHISNINQNVVNVIMVKIITRILLNITYTEYHRLPILISEKRHTNFYRMWIQIIECNMNKSMLICIDFAQKHIATHVSNTPNSTPALSRWLSFRPQTQKM